MARSRAGDGLPAIQRVANRPIVCHVVEALHASGIDEVAVVGDRQVLAEITASISADGVLEDNITYVSQDGAPGLIGALASAAEFVDGAPCVVHSASGLLAQPLGPFIEKFDQEQPDVMLLVYRGSDPGDRLEPKMQRLLGVSELDGAKTRLGLAGVALLRGGILGHPRVHMDRADIELDLTDVIDEIVCADTRVHAGFAQAWHRYIGNPIELLDLNRIVLDQQDADGEAFETGDNRIEGRVVIHPTAEVRSSVILGPSIIGPQARIGDTYIGPYTSVGARAHIEGAEIERSIILDGARIMHVGGRIEASTVGRGANIFRDFALPRALRLHVGADVEVALS